MSDQTSTPEYFDQIEKLIFVKIAIFEIPGEDICFPVNNYIGATVLFNLLKASLAAADLQPRSGGHVGPLNLCHLSFCVSNPHEASGVIVETLKQAGLERVARTFRYDPSEGVMRCLYPGRGDAIDFDAWMEENRSAHTAYELYQERTQARLAEMLKNHLSENVPGK